MNTEAKSKETAAMLAAFGGNFIFGFTFLFSKIGLAEAQTFVFLSYRFVLAFIILNLILLTGKVSVRLRGKPVAKVLAMGLFQPILYFIGENYGIQYTPTSFAGTMLALVPVVALGAGTIFLKEVPSRIQTISAFVSVAGVVVISAAGEGGSFSWVGTLLLLLAVCSSVAFNLVSRQISNVFTAFERTYVMFGLGSVFFTVAAMIQSRRNIVEVFLEPVDSVRFWVSILFLAGIASVGAFLMINFAVSHLSVARSTIFANLVTVVSIVAGVVILNERFTILQVVGSVMILLGVWGVNAPAWRFKHG